MLKPKLFYTMEEIREKITTDRIHFNDILLNFSGVLGMTAIVDRIIDFEDKGSELSDRIYELQVQLIAGNLDVKKRRRILKKINQSHKKILKIKEEIFSLIKGD